MEGFPWRGVESLRHKSCRSGSVTLNRPHYYYYYTHTHTLTYKHTHSHAKPPPPTPHTHTPTDRHNLMPEKKTYAWKLSHMRRPPHTHVHTHTRTHTHTHAHI